jgi:hypothetical protein
MRGFSRILRRAVAVLDGKPRGSKGQSLVEMTLTFPVLIVMVLGLVEIGFAANHYLILLDLVREAGRRGANLNPNAWDDAWDTRNFERMDCDREGAGNTGGEKFYNIDQNVSKRSIPRGLWLKTARGYKGEGYTPTGRPYESSRFGFFDTVTCQIILSMSPLLFEAPGDWGPPNYSIEPPDQSTLYSRNEIAVSAFAYTKLDFRHLKADGSGRWKYDPGNPNGAYLKLVSAGPPPVYASQALDANALDIRKFLEPPNQTIASGASSMISAEGTLMLVTRRYPTSNRYCAKIDADGKLQGDYRDPNHWQRATYVKDGTTYQIYTGSAGWRNNTATTPTDERDPNERHTTLLAEPGGTQGVRGFIFSGLRYDSKQDCYGSSFTVQDVEDLLNGELLSSALPEKLPNGGLVLVEMWWQHHPLILAPLFNFASGAFESESFYPGIDKDAAPDARRSDPVFYVYAIFPVSAAEPTPTPDNFLK